MQFFLSITLITGAFCAPGGVAQSPVPKPGMGGKIKLPSGMTKAKLSSGMGAKPVKPVTMPKLTPGKVNIGGKGGKPFTMPTNTIPHARIPGAKGM